LPSNRELVTQAFAAWSDGTGYVTSIFAEDMTWEPLFRPAHRARSPAGRATKHPPLVWRRRGTQSRTAAQADRGPRGAVARHLFVEPEAAPRPVGRLGAA
jgi:ketosteroid isomerase-like protein